MEENELQPPAVAAAAATKGRQRRILPWPRVLRQN